jgi:hypothetical protein
MPIDLKWIRTSPQEVQEWQRLRQIDNGDALVQEVVQLDIDCRQALSVLTAARTQIKRLQQSLRPQKTKKEHVDSPVVLVPAVIDRERILQEIKELQSSLPELQQNWQDSSHQVQQALVKIASPVDANIHQILPETTITTTPLPPLERKGATPTITFSFASNLGLDIYEAFLHYTRSSFRQYSITKFPSHVTLESSLAHAMWGCKSKSKQCAVCLKQPLDSWLGVIANNNQQGQQTNKTIYGAKQLPCFTSSLLRNDNDNNNNDNDAFQILAVAAGTLWDSRRVQQMLLQDILDFLSCLRIENGVTNNQEDASHATQYPFHAHAIDPSQLELHESSRVIIIPSNVAANADRPDGGSRPRILATISNFGDASSRACDLQFAGGGSRHSGTKDYCHVVVANIHVHSVLPWMLSSSSQRLETTDHTQVAIPRVIVQHMVRDMEQDGNGDDHQAQDYILVPVQELLQEKNTPVFSPRKDDGILKANAASGNSNGDDRCRLPFVTTEFPTRQSSEMVRMEALTSPFDFLFR